MEKPSLYLAGQSITLVTAHRTYTFIVERPFTPFTKSIAVLARSQEFAPDPVVLKIFDPRYTDERVSTVSYMPSRLWTLAHEQAAAALPRSDAEESDIWLDEPDDPEGQVERALLWEKRFLRISQETFEGERRAYEALRPLQGSVIPLLLSTGTVILPPDERAIQPPAIVLEYIPDAVTLADVAAGLLDPDMCAGLIRAVDSFSTYNMFHGDLSNPHNVLFSPAERPNRVAIIDFGCAGFKEDGEDEESWRLNLSFASDSKFIRVRLADKGIVVPGLADEHSSP